jgi:hypothetical protein
MQPQKPAARAAECWFCDPLELTRWEAREAKVKGLLRLCRFADKHSKEQRNQLLRQFTGLAHNARGSDNRILFLCYHDL